MCAVGWHARRGYRRSATVPALAPWLAPRLPATRSRQSLFNPGHRLSPEEPEELEELQKQDGACPACGNAADTLRHRLWECPKLALTTLLAAWAGAFTMLGEA